MTHKATQSDLHQRLELPRGLRETDERFTKLFRSCPAAVCYGTIEDSRIIEANPSYRRDAISRSHVRTSDRRHAIQTVEEEEALDTRLALVLAYLAVTPLILYVILRWFLSSS